MADWTIEDLPEPTQVMSQAVFADYPGHPCRNFDTTLSYRVLSDQQMQWLDDYCKSNGFTGWTHTDDWCVRFELPI